MRRNALFSVLSAKAKDNEILVIDDIKIESPKTKIIAKIFEDLFSKIYLKPERGRKKRAPEGVLIVSAAKDDNLLRATRNIPKTKLIEARNLNILDLLSFKRLVLLKNSIKVIKDTFVKTAYETRPR
jgi:large subunit ribosomal protein L4